MKKKDLSLNFAVFGLYLSSNDEKMYEIMNKFPGLVHACILEVLKYFKENGILDESNELVAKIGRNLDYSKCENDSERVATFIAGLCNILNVDLEESKEGD